MSIFSSRKIYIFLVLLVFSCKEVEEYPSSKEKSVIHVSVMKSNFYSADEPNLSRALNSNRDTIRSIMPFNDQYDIEAELSVPSIGSSTNSILSRENRSVIIRESISKCIKYKLIFFLKVIIL